jgi:hypothetical protein
MTDERFDGLFRVLGSKISFARPVSLTAHTPPIADTPLSNMAICTWHPRKITKLPAGQSFFF